MYCIIRKSTKQMGSYKWYLLAYQLSSFIFDFVFTVLILPMEYSCAESVIDIPRLHIFTPSSVRPLGIIALAQGVFAAIVTAYTIWLSFRFLRETNNMSQKTKAMQRRYLIYLCVQVSIPLFSLLIPVLVLLYILGMSADLGQGDLLGHANETFVLPVGKDVREKSTNSMSVHQLSRGSYDQQFSKEWAPSLILES
ncbi:hypothetical protein ANCCEY_05712 [Ancylostoma ceylanicum]|uniref:Uncharacterized protein n=1 Tax=Ancylostoma ceylanicum TaxID=53326 RepID=A0A0D6LVI1_9BILA|nr:hypothetical protein ANCCEY_05712 [Ancylostoma ceylanicum]